MELLPVVVVRLMTHADLVALLTEPLSVVMVLRQHRVDVPTLQQVAQQILVAVAVEP
jgi:hypothetical protein